MNMRDDWSEFLKHCHHLQMTILPLHKILSLRLSYLLPGSHRRLKTVFVSFRNMARVQPDNDEL